MAELKFCTLSQIVNTYHWSKFQVKSFSSSRVPEGGPCVFYRPVCKVPNTHGTKIFLPLVALTWQISLQEQISAKFTKPISQYVILAKFTFWSVKYQLNRWPIWNFANYLRLLISTTGQNFKIIAPVNLEILRGLEPPTPQDKSPIKNIGRCACEGLREGILLRKIKNTSQCVIHEIKSSKKH